jgi:hypothetical protein
MLHFYLSPPTTIAAESGVLQKLSGRFVKLTLKQERRAKGHPYHERM